MKILQLVYSYITKLYLVATGNQSSRSDVWITEIELKKISPFGFDSLVEDSGTIEEVVERKTLKFLSKVAEAIAEVYFWTYILFCKTYTLTVLYVLVLLHSPLDFSKFCQKVGNPAYPLQKISNVYFDHIRHTPT